MLHIKTKLDIPPATTLATVHDTLELIRGFAAVELEGKLGDEVWLDIAFIVDDSTSETLAREIIGVVQQVEEVNANLDGTGVSPLDLDELTFEEKS